ncbi:hypothetical protein D770_22165 [Flammeovirgaceae bacterium 311]|nr:hypothetical protein D770_22165 [Flammeovirgaceae bacterium 311]
MLNAFISFIRLSLMWFALMVSISTAHSVPPLEAKRDQLMEKRFSDSLAALREQDDAKTIALLKAMAHEFTEEMEKLKPQYQEWYLSLSAAEKRKLLYETDTKNWLQLMQEIQFDACIQRRFRENQKLKQEYESIQFLCDKAAEIAQ